MTDSPRELVDQIRKELRPLESNLYSHPFLGMAERGELGPETLKVFAGQQYQISHCNLRGVSMALARHSQLPSRRYLVEVIRTESAAVDAAIALGAAFDMTEAALDAVELLPSAHAYTSFISWIAMNGSDAEMKVAFTLNLPTWGAACRRLGDALAKSYGLSEKETKFFSLFADLRPNEEETLAIVGAALKRQASPLRISRAARLFQSHELMFWDAMGQLAERERAVAPTAGRS